MREDYLKAYKKGKKAYQTAVMQGKYPFLPALDDILGGTAVSSEMPLGIMEIPLSMVVGTKTRGRQEAFSCNFMPILDEDSEFGIKWTRLYDSQVEEGIRDPVKVYEFMWKFYVMEGNKRVSVLKYLDVPDIMADVYRILPLNKENKDVRIYNEFVTFFQAAPIYELCFSEEGCYKKLAEILGQNLKDPWPEDLVLELKSAFNSFSRIYRAKGGERLPITDADAFLIYLGIFRFDSFGSRTDKDIENRISRIWDEFLVEASDNSIAFLERPYLQKKDSLITLPWKKAPVYTEQNPMKAAFLYDRNPEDSRWIYGHELGRNHLEDYFQGIVRTASYPDCGTEEGFNQAVDAAVEEKSQVIFTTSPSMMDDTLRAAIAHPEIKFLNCSINLSHNAVRTYYGRMYEAKFLMGALAASMADNHRIGYVADYPIFGSLANINAFAIGAAFIDPEVKVYLTWSTLKDADWRDIIRDASVSILSGPDLIKPKEASREYGLYQIDGYNIRNLAAPVWNWGKYYELIIKTILNDTWPDANAARKDQALNYWWGMSAGVIDVILSKHLSYYSFKMIDALKSSLISGALHPFEGELHSQDGTIRGAENVMHLSNEEIVGMDWLNDNVVGSLPEAWSLNEVAKTTVHTSGVIEE